MGAEVELVSLYDDTFKGSFMERLMFPALTYNAKVDEATGEVKHSILDIKVATAMIYTVRSR